MIPADDEEHARRMAQLAYPDLEIRAVWTRERPASLERLPERP